MAGEVKLDSVSAKVNYTIGLQVGQGLKADGLEVNVAAFTQGVQDAVAGGDPKLTEEQMREAMMAFQEEQMALMAKAAEENSAAGAAFLAENKKKKGVETTDSGLQYRVITKGKGKKPAATDRVTVHYKGTLIDGTEFDSSYGRGEPTTFPVNGVIPGWVEALQLMREGATWELYIPSELAYGPRGSGAMIPPNSTLVFKVELLKVEEGHGGSPHGH
ncbi:MAG: FKBP-type peptidyl-prolyl cis-trans isomerase [Nitrospirota bacterium]|nr:FKBP-type peptidyl-prolyl cis-trans isomerase [Nitrospirota bacterium]